MKQVQVPNFSSYRHEIHYQSVQNISTADNSKKNLKTVNAGLFD